MVIALKREWRYVVDVAGTHGYDGEPDPGEWNHPESAISKYRRRVHRIYPANPQNPFVWCSVVDGLFWAKHKRVWSAEGHHLADYLRLLPPERRVVWAHSHGGQVAFYAALEIDFRLVTIATPVRKDMAPIIQLALGKGHLKEWWHLHSDWSDKMQIAGSLFDGAFGIERRFLYPGVQNIGLKGIGHSRALHEPALFDQVWDQTGIVAFTRDGYSQPIAVK